MMIIHGFLGSCGDAFFGEGGGEGKVVEKSLVFTSFNRMM